MSDIPWKQGLAAAFALAVAVAGGTFALVTYAKAAEIAEYRLIIERLDRRVAQLERRLAEKSRYEQPDNSSGARPNSIPNGEALSIEVISPKDGETVSQFSDVRYLVKGTIPDGYKPILVVHDPLDQWWAWGVADRGVHYNVQLGVSVDQGQPFEIRVIITDQEFPTNQPRRKLPRAIASESVTVVRD